MKKVAFLLKPLLLATFSALAVLSCQNEATTDTVAGVVQPLEVLTYDQLPPAIQTQISQVTLQHKGASYLQRERSFGAALPNKVHRLNRADGSVSYTLALAKTGSGLYYDNLVVEEDASGNLTKTILRYEPERAWLENSKGVYDYAAYSGKVSFFTEQGDLKMVATFTNGSMVSPKGSSAEYANRLTINCYITDVQYAGLEQDGVFYVTDIMYWFECEISSDGNMDAYPDSYHAGGGGSGVGTAPMGEEDAEEDGGGGPSGESPAPVTEGEAEDKITIDPSVTPCVQAIIAELMVKDHYHSLVPDITGDPGVSHLSQIILNLFSASQQYHINFQIGEAGLGVNASTDVEPNNPTLGQFTFTTVLDEEFVANATTLAIARTIIHESLHALLGYISQTNATSSFVQLLNDYRINQNISGNSQLGEHEFMTQFAEAIGHSLAVWDNHQLPQSYYNSLAWSGDMQNTQAFQSLPPEQQQSAINALIAEGQANAPATANAQGAPCN